MFSEIVTTKPVSIYIHWPYCVQKCPYCDFNSFVALHQLNFADWQKAYINQLRFHAKYILSRGVHSVFFGGGTPSLMPIGLVEAILNEITVLNNNTLPGEITLECNPSTIEVKKLKDFKLAGVNRISIGVQSFSADSLKILGRNHSSKEACQAIESANGIFERVSFDLINGLPEQTLNDWKEQLSTALPLAKSHISVYELTIEPGTAFARQGIPPAKDKVAQSLWEYTNEFLSINGLKPYEISNYAYLGQESMHNLHYWHGGMYVGIGPGAHGRVFDGKQIYASLNLKNPYKWLQKALGRDDNSVFSEYYPLTKEQRILELLVLNLRLYQGIAEELLSHLNPSAIVSLIHKELAINKSNNVYLTHKGRLQLNQVALFLADNLKL